eukprot:Plantae.Rhodophyta-Hildenbrandia_rubra.ctg29280.p1 GENE.Plantae.Rhodophyta-Hildenbrandia_rubra.ctg29280~~Plantae.Rhodophyta-Hildenbrandia_rubra.ctg29280.p1  ORF type:complete len:307 (-),score=64.69 Plantae.Rhodophyta-Hildenbrandia_rubra.ctg29280:1254-2174(-)
MTSSPASSSRWRKARNRKFSSFLNEPTDPTSASDFTFAVVADPQFGMLGSEKSWKEEVKICERAISKLNKIKPRFVVIVGDMVHHHPLIYGVEKEVMNKQITSFKETFDKLDDNIQVVCVVGNHDAGDAPTSQSLKDYKEGFGDDYFVFYVQGMRFVVCNTCLYNDASKAEKEFQEQERWLRDVLGKRHEPTFIFGHHPWFLYEDDEENDLEGFSLYKGAQCPDAYFHIAKEKRMAVLKLFEEAGVQAMFGGHWHQNKCSKAKSGMEMIITSALGAQLGMDKPGFRLVTVSPKSTRVSHDYIVTSS